MNKAKKILVGIVCAVLFAAGIFMISPQKNTSNLQAAGPLTYWGTEADNNGTSGDTQSNPYRIGSAATLNSAAVRTKLGTANKFFVLVNDINIADVTTNWTAIPALGSGSVFDGNGFTISNLKITSGSNTGLFNAMSGTIKNLTMADVNISTSGSIVAAVAAVPKGTTAVPSYFQNIIVKGTINGTLATSTKFGAICAEPTTSASNIKVIIEDCYNEANITCGYFVGGIIGHSNGSTVEIRRSGNEGNIKATGQYGYIGGIMGLAEGVASETTIEYCYNRGSITAAKRDCGGILGCAWAGTTTIKNCFNDSKLDIADISSGNKGVIVGYHGGTLTVSNCWYNTTALAQSVPAWTSHPSQGSYVNANASAATTGITQTVMYASSFLSNINPPAPQSPVFAMIDGKPGLTSMMQSYSYTFLAGDGQGTALVMYQAHNDFEEEGVLNVITLPSNDTENYSLPVKPGYVFDKWVNESDSNEYIAGASYRNTAHTDQVFTAKYVKAVYDIVFADTLGNPEYRINGTPTSPAVISIGNTNTTLYSPTISTWSSHNWMVLIAGADPTSDTGWAVIGQAQEISLTDLMPDSENGYKFISDYVENYSAEELENHPGKIGKITIKIINTSEYRNISVTTNLQDAGAFQYAVAGDNPITIPLNRDTSTKLSLRKNAGKFTLLRATAFQHYGVTSIEIYNGSNRLLIETNSDTIEQDDPALDLAIDANFTSGYEIRVTFEKIEYSFSVSAGYLQNGNYVQLNDAISLNNEEPATPIRINEMVTLVANAAYESETIYRFMTWKVLDFGEDRDGIYVPVDYGNFALNFTALADFDWLERYLNTDGVVTLIAEFSETYRISISVMQGQDEFGSVNVSVSENGMPVVYRSGMRIAKDSLVTIETRANTMYKFDSFQGGDNGDAVDNSSLNRVLLSFTVNKDRDIVACFTYETYGFSFYAEDKDKNQIPTVGHFTTEINNVVSEAIKIGDWLTKINYPEKDGYRFENFIIKDETGAELIISQTASFTPIYVSSSFLSKNLNAAKRFDVVAVYTRLIVLDISIYESCIGMGEFDVYYLADFIAGGNPTQDRSFDANEQIVIISKAGNYFEFNQSGFSGSNTDELDTENPNRLNITMDSIRGKRTISIKFTSKLIDFDDSGLTKKGNGEINVNKTDDYVVGEWVDIIASPGLNQQIKNWTLFGKKLETFNSNDYKKNGNTLSIRLSEEMLGLLAQNEFVLISDVEFALSDGVIMLITGPSVVIVLLIALLLFNFISLNKKKKVIRAELLLADKIKKTMGIGSLISDLREGKNVGQVTEEDVKAELKRRKSEKK